MDGNQVARRNIDTPKSHRAASCGFVRFQIFLWRFIMPASFLYCTLHYFSHLFDFSCPFVTSYPWFTIVSFLETVFFLATLRTRYHLLGAFPRAGFRTNFERGELFYRCCWNLPTLKRFLSVWFQGAPVEELRCDDVRDFLAWTFMRKTVCSHHDDLELSSYISHFEYVLDMEFPPGRSRHQAMRLSADPMQVKHKPLLYYLFVVGFSDLVSYMRLRLAGFDHYRLPLSKSLSVFPWRMHTVLSQDISPSEHLSYFYRPHTQRNRRPVLFLHGFGLGMSRYSEFLKAFDRCNGYYSAGVGIIALEIMPFTTRINEDDMLPRGYLVSEISAILAYHGWDEVTILAHSVGSVVASQLLMALGHTTMIGSMVLVDPEVMTLHWGDLPFNLFYRQPQTPAEWQMRYFFGADMTIAHSITQECGWQDNIVWRRDLYGRVVTFIVSDDDILVDSRALMEHLTASSDVAVDAASASEVAEDTERYVERRPRVAILHERMGHGQVFDSPERWAVLKAVLHQHCRIKEN